MYVSRREVVGGVVYIFETACITEYRRGKVWWQVDLQVVIFFREGNCFGLCQFPGVLIHQRRIDLNLSRSEGRCSDEFKGTISDELPCKPKEGLLEVVVGLGRDLEVLEILLAMECHRASLHLSFFYVNFVSAQHNGDVLAHTLEVTMPVRNILVCDTRSDVKHDDTTLALDVVTIAKTTKLFLSGGIPDVKTDGAKVGREV